MGSQLSHTRLPFQKKWTTPIQPFDPDYFKKLDEKLKAEKKEKKSAVKSSTKSAKRKQEDQKPVAAPKPVQFFQPAKWWLGTELDDKTTKEDEQKPVTVFTSPLISSPLLPDDNSLPKPPSGPGIPDYRLFILPGQAELSDEEVQEILQQDVKPHVPTNPDDVVTVTLPDLDKPILTMPWKKSKKEEHQLPLEKVLKKSKPSKSTSPVLPLDEELFDTPEPVLQDFEEPDVKFGRYENRCPTRGGLRFELVFEDEEEHLLAPKPNLDVENPKRKRKELKKELKKKQTAAEARRKQILLADILPTFIIKLIVPYFMHYFPYWIRVLTVVLFNSASYITVALADSITVVLLGVVFASISSGLGEITFLAFTARYDKSTVAGWSSGTGASGVGAALIYTGLSAFLSPKVSILIQLITPVIMELSYLFLLGKPNEIVDTLSKDNNEEGGDTRGGDSENEENESETNSKDTLNLLDNQPVQSDTGKRQIKLVFLQKPKVSLVKHLKCIPRVFFYYMIWLFLVYASEYMINHSLHESLYYPNTHIGNYCLQQNIQYKWYQVTYQLGVFLSRTSILLFHIKYFHFLAILQAVNLIFLLLEVVYQFIPSFWITLFIVLYEGLLGGGVYANAFYSISKRVDPIHKEFAMGVASAADSTGITVAGGLSHFVHDFICSLGY